MRGGYKLQKTVGKILIEFVDRVSSKEENLRFKKILALVGITELGNAAINLAFFAGIDCAKRYPAEVQEVTGGGVNE